MGEKSWGGKPWRRFRNPIHHWRQILFGICFVLLLVFYGLRLTQCLEALSKVRTVMGKVGDSWFGIAGKCSDDDCTTNLYILWYRWYPGKSSGHKSPKIDDDITKLQQSANWGIVFASFIFFLFACGCLFAERSYRDQHPQMLDLLNDRNYADIHSQNEKGKRSWKARSIYARNFCKKWCCTSYGHLLCAFCWWFYYVCGFVAVSVAIGASAVHPWMWAQEILTFLFFVCIISYFWMYVKFYVNGVWNSTLGRWNYCHWDLREKVSRKGQVPPWFGRFRGASFGSKYDSGSSEKGLLSIATSPNASSLNLKSTGLEPPPIAARSESRSTEGNFGPYSLRSHSPTNQNSPRLLGRGDGPYEQYRGNWSPKSRDGRRYPLRNGSQTLPMRRSRSETPHRSDSRRASGFDPSMRASKSRVGAAFSDRDLSESPRNYDGNGNVDSPASFKSTFQSFSPQEYSNQDARNAHQLGNARPPETGQERSQKDPIMNNAAIQSDSEPRRGEINKIQVQHADNVLSRGKSSAGELVTQEKIEAEERQEREEQEEREKQVEQERQERQKRREIRREMKQKEQRERQGRQMGRKFEEDSPPPQWAARRGSMDYRRGHPANDVRGGRQIDREEYPRSLRSASERPRPGGNARVHRGEFRPYDQSESPRGGYSRERRFGYSDDGRGGSPVQRSRPPTSEYSRERRFGYSDDGRGGPPVQRSRPPTSEYSRERGFGYSDDGREGRPVRQRSRTTDSDYRSEAYPYDGDMRSISTVSSSRLRDTSEASTRTAMTEETEYSEVGGEFQRRDSFDVKPDSMPPIRGPRENVARSESADAFRRGASRAASRAAKDAGGYLYDPELSKFENANRLRKQFEDNSLQDNIGRGISGGVSAEVARQFDNSRSATGLARAMNGAEKVGFGSENQERVWGATKKISKSKTGRAAITVVGNLPPARMATTAYKVSQHTKFGRAATEVIQDSVVNLGQQVLANTRAQQEQLKQAEIADRVGDQGGRKVPMPPRKQIQRTLKRSSI